MLRMVCGFAFLPNEKGLRPTGLVFPMKLVLIHKTRGPDSVRGRLNGVGGRLEPWEHPVEAMVREFEEETGAKTRTGDWGDPYVRLHGANWEVNFFRRFGSLPGLRIYEASPTDERVVLMDAHPHLLGNVVPNLHWLVPLALDPCLDLQNTLHIHDVS